MKYLLTLLIALVCSAKLTNTQQPGLVGSWLMIKVEVNGNVDEPYFITEFKADGNFLVMGMEAGTWTHDKANNTMEMKSKLDKDFNGEGKILKLTSNTLELDKDGAKCFYQKVDEAKIATANKESGLLGVWEFKDVPNSDATSLLTFTQPDEFTLIQIDEYSSSTLDGTWIFDNENNAIILIGLRGEDTFNGKNKIEKINKQKLNLKNRGTTYQGTKKEQNTTKIEHLTFTSDVFFDDAGDYKYYDDEEKLPWRNWSEMKTDLINIEHLVYHYTTLTNGTETAEIKTLKAAVKATLGVQGFQIDNIFNGRDRYDVDEDTEFKFYREYSKALYPIDVDIFRIVGTEDITVPAGTFDCTVLEGTNKSGELTKLWMITDKIGTYAKVIVENKDEIWGHYSVYELTEIELKK